MIKRYLDKIEEVILLIMLIAICFSVLLQVFFRYIIGIPLTWSEELARFILVWLTLFGAGYAVKKNLHIELTFFFDKLPLNVQKIVQILINFLCVGFFIYLIPVSIELVIRQHSMESTSLGIPMSYLYLSVPVSLVILILRMGEQTIQIIKGNPLREDEIK